MIEDKLNAHIETVRALYQHVNQIRQIGRNLAAVLKSGDKVLLMGNGGSAADCQHIAAELVGRFKTDRYALPAIALTTDTSIITALGNDYGYDDVFSRQVEGLAHKGDMVIGISTSGNSTNILKAMESARKRGCYTVALLGKDGGRLQEKVDLSLVVPSDDTARIQECHILIGHIICEMIDEAFNENNR